MRDRLRKRIREQTSPHHVPKKILQVADIPRTLSGKITELAVREVIHGRSVRNVDALANPQALELYRDLEDLRSYMEGEEDVTEARTVRRLARPSRGDVFIPSRALDGRSWVLRRLRCANRRTNSAAGTPNSSQ